MTSFKLTAALGVSAILLSACAVGGPGGPDKSRDRGFRPHHLSDMTAGIWVDPNGCDHWIIDDGVEGYLSVRLDPYGKPICSGVAPPNTAVGPYKVNATIPDSL